MTSSAQTLSSSVSANVSGHLDVSGVRCLHGRNRSVTEKAIATLSLELSTISVSGFSSELKTCLTMRTKFRMVNNDIESVLSEAVKTDNVYCVQRLNEKIKPNMAWIDSLIQMLDRQGDLNFEMIRVILTSIEKNEPSISISQYPPEAREWERELRELAKNNNVDEVKKALANAITRGGINTCQIWHVIMDMLDQKNTAIISVLLRGFLDLFLRVSWIKMDFYRKAELSKEFITSQIMPLSEIQRAHSVRRNALYAAIDRNDMDEVRKLLVCGMYNLLSLVNALIRVKNQKELNIEMVGIFLQKIVEISPLLRDEPSDRTKALILAAQENRIEDVRKMLEGRREEILKILAALKEPIREKNSGMVRVLLQALIDGVLVFPRNRMQGGVSQELRASGTKRAADTQGFDEGFKRMRIDS